MSDQTESSPSTSAPVESYLAQYQGAGISPDRQFVVLPARQLAQLPLALQHQLVEVLAHTHQAMDQITQPAYRVVPSRWVPIHGLDEDGLRAAGLVAEIDPHGQLVYRDTTTGRQLEPAETAQYVLVPTTVTDPV